MNTMRPSPAQQIWHEASEKVKDRVIAPTLYRSLEAGIGITVEEDVFVVGYSSTDMPLAGHLRDSRYQALIEQCLSEILSRSIRLKIVEGSSLADYEDYKRLQALADSVRLNMTQRKSEERAIEHAWEEIAEKIVRGYARTELRQFAQTKGRYIKKAFEIINDACNEMGYTDDATEAQKRAMARVWEKFATAIGVPSAILAYEFFKLKDEGKLK